MRFFFTFLLLLILISLSAQKQEEELSLFYKSFFHDSTRYNYNDYLNDSAILIENLFGEILCANIKNRIDTIKDFTNIMIVTDNGKFYFDSISAMPYPLLYFNEKKEKENLLKLLTNDTLLFIENPFKKSNLNKNIRDYNKSKRKFSFIRFASNQKFIKIMESTETRINNLDLWWDQFQKKCCLGYITCCLPIFNDSYEYAYFEWSYSCGSLCGNGYSGVYRKINGRWTPISIIETWIN